ncbi:hypothetical protein [Mycolicibacter kumamotonensis]|uniref:hypothetical protein n=1 Tax=Mycolicibacter kumamotonensis TaxID=354243 RepID=UPI001F1ED124|nr:hypothetical protein [Mycolicibacter kumamotonensis]
MATQSVDVLPPGINKVVVFPRPVSRLHPGMQVLVGEGTRTTVCTAGFYLSLPDASDPGTRLDGFVTAARCARGDGKAPDAVMKVEDAGMAPTRTKVGEITYLTPGEASPRAAGEPWTIPIFPFAVFSSGRDDWGLPVDATINEEPPTAQVVQTADAVENSRALVAWAGLDGRVAAGHVLDPAATPELRGLPTGSERVVVAADDIATPIGEQLVGAAVTAQVDGSTQNLGIITGIDETRHWLIVDLIGPFLARQNAALVLDR